MEKQYVELDIKVVLISTEDVIRTSTDADAVEDSYGGSGSGGNWWD